MQIKAIFFDMGGTLEDLALDRQLMLDTCCSLLPQLAARGLRFDYSPEALLDVIDKGTAAYKEWALSTMIEASPEDIWSNWIFKDSAADRAKIRDLADFLADAWEAGCYRRAPQPGALGTVRRLKSMGMTVGVISNTQSRTQVQCNLKRYGLVEEVRPVMLSSLAGLRKPHPALFLAAAGLAGVSAAESLYVGDTYSRDIRGAFAAGFRGSILISSCMTGRFTDEIDPNTLPDEIKRNYLSVTKLEEIPGILERFV